MANDEGLISIDFVKKYAESTGALHAHDIEAVDAIYPGFVKETVRAVSSRFAGRAVPSGSEDELRRHIAALVVDALWKRRGLENRDAAEQVRMARDAATGWLDKSESLTKARASVAPGPGPLTPENEK